MKITFLGTGTSQGVPVIGCDCAVCKSPDPKDNRLRTSALIETEACTLVIDTGPDFRQQMLREDVRDLDAVLFTHHHKDHVAGLDDVRAFNFKYERPMPVYANGITLQGLKQEFSYIFSDLDYPGIPQVDTFEVKEAPIEVKGLEVIPIPVLHYKLPVLGYRIGDLAYITDANYISPESRAKLRGLKLLVLNALRHEDHISHFTLEQALQVVDDLRPERAYFTHMSHLLGRHADINAELPDGVELAYDGLQVLL